MTLRDDFVTDAAVFTETDEFGETITFKPQNGSSKSIEAVVKRGQSDTSGQDRDKSVLNRAEVWFSKDATLGSETVKKSFDKLSFPPTEDGDDVDWVILEIVNRDDPGMWRVICGR